MVSPLNPFSQNQRLGRGINVIGYDPLWKSRDEARMQAKHFRLIAEAGFNHVRINLHPFRAMGDGPPYAIRPSWLETLDWALANSLENGLAVIIDMHEFGRLGQEPHTYRPQFVATWRQLAERYRHYPEDVFFEILNEPNKELTPELWNTYYQEPYQVIRESNPNRTLIIGPGQWNGIDALDALQLPEDDRNLIVTVHYYRPMPFTHQGAGWTEYKGRRDVAWMGTPAEQQDILADFEKAQAWAGQRQRPLYLGEFGAYDKADMASRARYTGFVARQAEKLGWSWGYWQFDSDFVAYDIPADRWVEPIRDALIPAGA
ncbi:MAG: glycoside hydrolase family 5 protein [Chloroflexota bacterium]